MRSFRGYYKDYTVLLNENDVRFTEGNFMDSCLLRHVVWMTLFPRLISPRPEI